jgi:flagellar basal-body rod protein FlgC
MYGSLDISVSGMIAQRTRLNTIAANLANQNTILDANGEPNPYQRRATIFVPGDPDASSNTGRNLGVHVAEITLDDAPFRKKYEPGSPYAKPDGHPDAGYVYYPNVDPVTEQVNAMEAQRAYQANVIAAEAAKSLMAQALRLIG